MTKLAGMPKILVTFMDGKVVAAEAPLVDFRSPILRLTAIRPGDNNRDFLVPLTSVKYLVFGGEEEELEGEKRAGGKPATPRRKPILDRARKK